MRRISIRRTLSTAGAAVVLAGSIGVGVPPATAIDAEPAAIVTSRVIQHLTPTQVVARGEISPLETYVCPQETHPWLVREKLSDWYPLPLGVGEVTNGKWMELVPSADPHVGSDGRVIGITNAKFHNVGAKTFEGYFVLHCTNDVSWTYP